MAIVGYFHPDVYTDGLQEISDHADVLHLCSALPADYTEASDTLALGIKNTPTVGQPTLAAGGGYEVIVEEITDGTCTGEGTATHWALIDSVSERLLAAKKMVNEQEVYPGNIFSLGKDGGTDFAVGFLPPEEEA